MTRTLGMWLALLAMLSLPACGTSATERWVREPLAEEIPEGPRRYSTRVETGRLELTANQETLVRKGSVDRLYIDYEETYSDTTIEQVGLVIASVIGGIVSVGLYFLVWFVFVDEADEATSGE